jgi:hypothetical protein
MWLDALTEKRSAEFCSLVLIKRHPYLHRYDRRWNTVLQILWLGFNFPCFGLKERTLQSFRRTKYDRSWLACLKAACCIKRLNKKEQQGRCRGGVRAARSLPSPSSVSVRRIKRQRAYVTCISPQKAMSHANVSIKLACMDPSTRDYYLLFNQTPIDKEKPPYHKVISTVFVHFCTRLHPEAKSYYIGVYCSIRRCCSLSLCIYEQLLRCCRLTVL